MVINKDVKEAFLKRKELKNPNLSSDGKSLWSFGWWEVARWVRGKVVLRNGPSYSQSTAIHHRTKLKGTPAKKKTPKAQGIMNL